MLEETAAKVALTPKDSELEERFSHGRNSELCENVQKTARDSKKVAGERTSAVNTAL